MTTARSRRGTRLAGASLLLALFACGDDTSPTAAPTPTPPTPTSSPTAPPASVVIQGEQALPAPPNPKGGTSLVKWDFTLPVSGTVEATVSYQYDTSRILVWLTDRPCNKWQFQRDECFYLTKSLEGPRPRVLTVTGVKPGSYTLFVANDGPHDEVIGHKVTLLPGSNGLGRLSSGSSTGSAAR